MISSLNKLLTLIIGTTLTFSVYAQEKKISYLPSNIVNDSINFFSQIENDRGNEGIKKANEKFNMLIAEAEKKDASISKVIEKFSERIIKLKEYSLKARKEILKKNQIAKITSENSNIRSNDLINTVMDNTDNDRFEELTIRMIDEIVAAGDEVTFLRNMRDKFINNINLSNNKGLSLSRNIASEPSFEVSLAMTVVFGGITFGSVYGMIFLFSVGTILAALGIVALGAVAVFGFIGMVAFGAYTITWLKVSRSC